MTLVTSVPIFYRHVGSSSSSSSSDSEDEKPVKQAAPIETKHEKKAIETEISNKPLATPAVRRIASEYKVRQINSF